MVRVLDGSSPSLTIAAACLPGSWWFTDRWRWVQRAELVYSEGCPGWWCWKPSWSLQTGSLHKSLVCPDVGGCSAIPCWLHHPQTCLLCRKTAGVQQDSSNVLQVGEHKPLKYLHHHRRWSNRSVVIKSCDFWFLGTGMMMECLKQEGTSHYSSDLLKINVKINDSWTAQALR